LVTPMKGLHPLFHDSRMTSFEFRHFSPISIIVTRISRVKHFIGGIHAPVDWFQGFGLALHGLGRSDPAVVKDAGIDGFHGQFFCTLLVLVTLAIKIRYFAEGLSCPEGVDFGKIANDPNFLLVPAMLMGVVVVVSVKMDIIEKESFYAMVIQPLFTLLDDYWKIIFMNHFIGLHIYKPVAGACFLGDVSLMGVFSPSGEFFQIPYGIDNFYFIGLKGHDFFPGPVILVSFSQRKDKFIYDRQDGRDRLFDGVIQFGCIAAHAKSGNFHILFN